jgi:hypothetical protein
MIKKFVVVKDNRIVKVSVAQREDFVQRQEGEEVIDVSIDKRIYRVGERYKKFLWLIK